MASLRVGLLSLTYACQGAGGVRQYIHKTFPMRSTRTREVSNIIMDAIEPLENQSYLEFFPIPACLKGASLEYGWLLKSIL